MRERKRERKMIGRKRKKRKETERKKIWREIKRLEAEKLQR